MRKNDVTLNGRYYAKISGLVVIVRITAESRFGGWTATNESSGREVRIKTAAKLRGAVGATGLPAADERRAAERLS